MCNPQLIIKNDIGITLNLSSNVVGDSNDETNFPHKLLLTKTQQVSRLCTTFTSGSSADVKSSKTQLLRIGQSGGFFNEKYTEKIC